MADESGLIKPVTPWDHPFGRPNQVHANHGWVSNYRTAGLADMVDALQSGRQHRCSLELAIHAVDVMTSILRSGESGNFEEIATRCDRPEPLTPEAAAALMV